MVGVTRECDSVGEMHLRHDVRDPLDRQERFLGGPGNEPTTFFGHGIPGVGAQLVHHGSRQHRHGQTRIQFDAISRCHRICRFYCIVQRF
jgi:hypothetical protein